MCSLSKPVFSRIFMFVFLYFILFSERRKKWEQMKREYPKQTHPEPEPAVGFLFLVYSSFLYLYYSLFSMLTMTAFTIIKWSGLYANEQRVTYHVFNSWCLTVKSHVFGWRYFLELSQIRCLRYSVILL